MAQKFRFRNIYGELLLKWDDIVPMGGSTDGFIIAGNSKFIAFPLQGGMGSTLGVLAYHQAGRVKQVPAIQAHSSHITDFKFLPYQENRIATCSQDSTIKVWELQDENNTEVKAPIATLEGHDLKVNLIAPHHAAQSVLASSSYDKTIKIWDWQEEKDVLTIEQGTHYAQGLEWSFDGQLLGTTWNDNRIRLIDPRQQKFLREFQAHTGTRSQKLAWLGNTNLFATTGVDKTQKREISLWDIRNTSNHIVVNGCSQGQGTLHPFYDADLGILFTTGKGEGNVRFFEYQNGNLYYHNNDYLCNEATKGYAFMPKYNVNPYKNEICRAIKLLSKSIELVQIIHPRKTNDFCADLFPETAVDYSITSDAWINGTDSLPKLGSLSKNGPPKHTQKEQAVQNNVVTPIVQQVTRVPVVAEQIKQDIVINNQNNAAPQPPQQVPPPQAVPVRNEVPPQMNPPVAVLKVEEQIPPVQNQVNVPENFELQIQQNEYRHEEKLLNNQRQQQEQQWVLNQGQQQTANQESWQNFNGKLEQLNNLSTNLNQDFNELQNQSNQKDLVIQQLSQQAQELERIKQKLQEHQALVELLEKALENNHARGELEQASRALLNGFEQLKQLI